MAFVGVGLIANGQLGRENDDGRNTNSHADQQHSDHNRGAGSGEAITDAEITAAVYFVLGRMVPASVADRGALVVERRSGEWGVAGDVPASDLSAIICVSEWSEFCRGYRDFGGRPEWERHFIDDVLPCEGSRWSGYYGLPYWSRAQFSGDTWLKVRAAFGVVDAAAFEFADSAFWTGAAVAWWSNEIDHPGGTGGWPGCW